MHPHIGNCTIRDYAAAFMDHTVAFRYYPSFPNLAKFACDILLLLPSGCKVEREFSILGKIMMRQWSSLSASTIANSIMCNLNLFAFELEKNLCGIWLPPTENQKFNADL